VKRLVNKLEIEGLKMFIIKKIKSEKGSTIIQAMIIAAFIAALMVAVMQNSSNASNQFRSEAIRANAKTLGRVISTYAIDEALCSASFRFTSTPPAGTAPTAVSSASILADAATAAGARIYLRGTLPGVVDNNGAPQLREYPNIANPNNNIIRDLNLRIVDLRLRAIDGESTNAPVPGANQTQLSNYELSVVLDQVDGATPKVSIAPFRTTMNFVIDNTSATGAPVSCNAGLTAENYCNSIGGVYTFDTATNVGSCYFRTADIARCETPGQYIQSINRDGSRTCATFVASCESKGWFIQGLRDDGTAICAPGYNSPTARTCTLGSLYDTGENTNGDCLNTQNNTFTNLNIQRVCPSGSTEGSVISLPSGEGGCWVQRCGTGRRVSWYRCGAGSVTAPPPPPPPLPNVCRSLGDMSAVLGCASNPQSHPHFMTCSSIANNNISLQATQPTYAPPGSTSYVIPSTYGFLAPSIYQAASGNCCVSFHGETADMEGNAIVYNNNVCGPAVGMCDQGGSCTTSALLMGSCNLCQPAGGGHQMKSYSCVAGVTNVTTGPIVMGACP
jgi:competence protein ComGC